MVDIHSLELEFARAKSIEACLPLCEAYISANRFMEAMVVCKKGIKIAPEDPRGRAMLSLVYCDQGKMPKAQQEIAALLAQFPGHPEGIAIQGRMLMRQGDSQGAIALLQQALGVDPTHVYARAWLGELGVQISPATPPQAQPVISQQPALPQQPVIQAQPVMPQQPALPQQPVIQAQPVIPQQPALPQQPVIQAQPVIPQQPALPQQPVIQAQPVSPTQPPMPQQPVIQAQPVMPPQPFAQALPTAPGTMDAPLPAYQPTAQPPLEHVSDFFATEALGFDSDGADIETAGPGRLTIVGFVPKNTGSIKKSIAIILGFIAVASMVIGYVYVNSKNKREINALYRQMTEAIDHDKFSEYHAVLGLATEIFKIDPTHVLTQSTAAYAALVLGAEHHDVDMIEEGKRLLTLAMQSDQENEWRIAAVGRLAHFEKRYQEGLDAVNKVAERSSRPIVHLEALRLMQALEPESKATQKEIGLLVNFVVGEARVFNYLGWHYFNKEDYALADKNFSSALQNSKGHPQALIGKAMTHLGRNIGMKELQKEVEKSLRKVFGLPQDELSIPVHAMAYFARGQLRNWQGKLNEARSDYGKAVKRDPTNSFFPFQRGWGEQRLGNCKDAIGYLKTAVKLKPKNVHYLEKLAGAQVCIKAHADANKTLKTALGIAPKNAALLLLLADNFRSQRKLNDAKKAYEAVTIKTHGGRAFTEANIGISATYRGARKGKSAVKHLEMFMKSAPTSIQSDKKLQAKLWHEMGLAHEASGNSKKALFAFETGVEQYRYYSDNHYAIAKLQKFRGPKAKESCKIYMTLAPRGKYAGVCKKYK